MYIKLTTSLCAVVIFACSPAFAQLPGQQMSPQEKRKLAKQKFKTQEFPQPVKIPNLPDYPASKGGIKFVRGLKYSSLGQGDNCVVQNFLLKDPPETVKEFYNQQLASNRWFIQPANASGTQILARRPKEGASCHIMVTPSPQQSASPDRRMFKTAVQIRYVQWQPLSDE